MCSQCVWSTNNSRQRFRCTNKSSYIIHFINFPTEYVFIHIHIFSFLLTEILFQIRNLRFTSSYIQTNSFHPLSLMHYWQNMSNEKKNLVPICFLNKNTDNPLTDFITKYKVYLIQHSHYNYLTHKMNTCHTYTCTLNTFVQKRQYSCQFWS